MNLSSYPSYKPSKVEWAGDIPVHWDEKRLRFVAIRSDEKVEADADNPVQYVGMEHIESWTGKLLPLDAELVPSGISNRFRSGDVLFGKLRPYLAKASVLEFDGLCSSELLVLKTRNHDRKYLLYQLLSEGFISVVDSSTYGAKMPRASWDFIGACAVPCPDLDEQRAIADFLDRETAKLDTLVEKKRVLIEKLKEKRAALISCTVTRGLPPDAARAAGLNPHPNLKPSGVEWLRDVPAHWVVSKLSKKLIVLDCKHKTVSFIDGGVPVASIREVHGFEVDLTGANQTTEEEYLDLIEGDRKPRAGDIVYSRNATVGDAALVATEDKFCMGQDVCLIRLRENHPLFVLYFFRSLPAAQQLEALMIGSTFRRINVGQIKAFWICLPPVSEQRAIAEYLARETTKIDRLVEKVEAAIERLREYRTALITAAVTGKIDVREHAQHRPAA